jgi:hypothetical protein
VLASVLGEQLFSWRMARGNFLGLLFGVWSWFVEFYIFMAIASDCPLLAEA